MAALASGCPGKALRRLNRTPLVEPTPAVVNRLRLLHPQEPSSTCARSGFADDALTHIQGCLRHVTRNATLGAGPIGSQGRPLANGVRKAKQQQPLTRPRQSSQRNGARRLADALLLAIPKKSGGERPIAVGEVLRRAAARALIRLSINNLRNISRQFVLRQDGCLTVASLLKFAIESDDNACVIQIDMSNAFNCIHRSAVLRASDATPLAHYARWAYAEPSRLIIGSETILSSSGVQQGDPAGPALFAMALSETMALEREMFPPNLLDLWYADDGCLVGALQAVIDGYNQLFEPLATIGLKINSKKCLLWSRDVNASAPAEVPLAAPQSTLTVLGFPITGTEDSLLDFGRHAVDNATKTLYPISRLRHTQGEVCILRACGPTAKLRHLLRLTDLAELRSCLYEADIHTLASVE